jgi:hypothetical protein
MVARVASNGKAVRQKFRPPALAEVGRFASELSKAKTSADRYIVKTSGAIQQVGLTNGSRRSQVLAGIDKRSLWYRRFRDLSNVFANDLGQQMSGAQQAIAQRAAALCVECELMEATFSRQGGASLIQLEVFQRTSNSMRRLLESLGINRGRVPKSVNDAPTLSQYLGRRRSSHRTTIDADVEEADDA